MGEGAVVLVREQRRGHEHGDLKPVLDGLEGGAERHFRLAEPHVAADQPVHGPRPLHVAEHLFDGALLVRRLLEGKGGLELAVEIIRRREGRALLGLARRVDGDEFPGDLEDVFFTRSLVLAQAGAPRRSSFGAAPSAPMYFLDLVEAVERNVQLGIGLVAQSEEIRFEPVYGDMRQALVFAHAVVGVDYVISGLELLERGEKGRGLCFSDRGRCTLLPKISSSVMTMRLSAGHENPAESRPVITEIIPGNSSSSRISAARLMKRPYSPRSFWRAGGRLIKAAHQIHLV